LTSPESRAATGAELVQRVEAARAALTVADYARDRLVAIPPAALAPVLRALYREAIRRLEPVVPDGELGPFDTLLESQPDTSATPAIPRDWQSLRDSLERVVERAERRSRPEPVVPQRQLRRIARGVLAFLVVAGALFVLLQPRDLAKGASFRTSSTWAVCRPAEHLCGSSVTDILFHTNEDDQPFIEYDLGAPRDIASVRVTNRNILRERAVPLVLEVSDDGRQYRALARKDEAFDRWFQRFPRTKARFVRLRAARRTVLHLERVEIYGP
jgi:hypothetical protein